MIMKAEILLFLKRSFPVSFQQDKTSEIECKVEKVVLKRGAHPLHPTEMEGKIVEIMDL